MRSSFRGLVLCVAAVAIVGCSSTSGSRDHASTTGALGAPSSVDEAAALLHGYYVNRAPESMTGDAAARKGIHTIELREDGTYTSNATPDGRNFLLSKAASGSWTLTPGAGLDGYRSTLVLAPNDGDASSFAANVFPDGTFQLDVGGIPGVFFHTDNPMPINAEQQAWLAACDTPCPNDGVRAACHTAPATDPGCADSLCPPVRSCDAAATAPEAATTDDAQLAATVIGQFESKPEEDDPIDGTLARKLTLDANGRFLVEFDGDDSGTGNWGVERATPSADGTTQSGRLRLRYTDGTVDVFKLDVVDANAFDLGRIPVTERFYRVR